MDTYNIISTILSENHDFLGHFSRDKYADAFKTFCEKYADFFKSVNTVYNEESDKMAYVDSLADSLIAPIKEEYDKVKKSNKSNYLIDNNLLLVIYLLPAIGSFKGDFSEDLQNSITTKWNAAFNQKIKAGNFEEINSGFKRKLCYVTTAVCQSLGKDDACEEIRLLKDYRDTYLILEPDGKELIETYYDIAPTIVNRINKCENSEAIYRDIYINYIYPCVCFIQSRRLKDCKELYVKMMYNLKSNYMI